MSKEFKKYLPNQSGTFSNRVNFHDENNNKSFVIEMHTEDVQERLAIVSAMRSAPELLEALQAAEFELESLIPATDVEVLRKVKAALSKALD